MEVSTSKMFIENYFGLDVAKFKRTMRATNAFISGSFALYWYLFQVVSAKTNFPEDSDMDIYIPGVSEKWLYRHKQICLNAFDLLLEKSGYIRQPVVGPSFYESSLIYSVVTYTNNRANFGRSIQLIFLIEPCLYGISKDYACEVTETFDLDICKFVVDSDLDVLVPMSFREMTEAEIKDRLGRKVMKQTLEHQARSKTLDKCLSRLEKYYQRGFTVEVEHQCLTCKCPTVKKLLTLDEAKEVVVNEEIGQ